MPILSAGWDSDAIILTILKAYHHICSGTYMLTQTFKNYLPLMQTLDKVYSIKSLIFELLLHGNHHLSTTCQGLHHYSNKRFSSPPNASRFTSHQRGLLFPQFASPTVDQNQSLHRLTRRFSHKPNCRVILILQQSGKLNFFTSYIPTWTNSNFTWDFSQIKTKQLSKQRHFKNLLIEDSKHCCTSAVKQFFWRPLNSYTKLTSAFPDSST